MPTLPLSQTLHLTLPHLLTRQLSTSNDNSTSDLNNNDDGFDNPDSWWYSSTAYIIKWAVVAAIFVVFMIYFVGGLLHARRRMKRGLPPLRYHRWLVPRRQRAAFYAAHPNLPESQRYLYEQQFSFYRPGYGDSRAHNQGYQMNPYGPNGQHQQGPAPPAYGHEDWVPAYTPPAGATKMNPDQSYVAPQGPPPGQQTGTVASGSGNEQQPAEGDLGRGHDNSITQNRSHGDGR